MQTTILAIVAGMVICLGAIASCCVKNVIISAFIFTIGLIIISNFNFKLFMENAKCERVKNEIYMGNIHIWTGNFLGILIVFTILIAFICETSTSVSILANIAKGKAIYDDNTLVPFASLVTRGCICGALMVFIASKYKKNKKRDPMFYIIIYTLGISIFMLIKAKYYGADMYYLLTFTEISNIPRTFLRLIAIGAGNLYGAIIVWLELDRIDRKKK